MKAFFSLLILAYDFWLIFLLSNDSSLNKSWIDLEFTAGISYLIFLIIHRKSITWEQFFIGFTLILLLCVATHQSTIEFPTNFIVSRNIIKGILYLGVLILFYILARKSATNMNLATAFSIIWQSSFFYISDSKGLHFLPFLCIYLLYKRNDLKNAFSSGSILSLILILFLNLVYNVPVNNQQYVLIYFSFLCILLVLLVSLLNEKEFNFLFSAIYTLFFIESLLLVYYIWSQSTLVEGFPIYRVQFLNLPTSFLGAFGAIGFLFGFFHFLKLSGWRKVLVAVSCLLSIVLVYFSHSRNSYFSILLPSLYLIYIQYRRKISVYQNRVLFVGLLLGILIPGILFVFLRSFDQGQTIGIRTEIWGIYIIKVLQFSPIFGFGAFPEQSIFYYPLDSYSIKEIETIKNYLLHFKSFPPAHNTFIQLFSMFGLIGLIFGFRFFIFLLREGILKYKEFNNSNNYNYNLSMAVIFFVFLHGFGDYHFFETFFIFPFLLSIGFFFSKKAPKEEATKKGFFILGKGFIIILFLTSIYIVTRFLILSNIKNQLSKGYNFYNLSPIEHNGKTDITNPFDDDYSEYFINYPRDLNFETWKIVWMIDEQKKLQNPEWQGVESEISRCKNDFSNHPFCIALENRVFYILNKSDIQIEDQRKVLNGKDPFQTIP